MTLKRIVCFMFLIFAVQLSLVLCSQSTIDDHDVSETGEIENSTKGNSSNAVVQNYNIYTEDYYEVTTDGSVEVFAIVAIIIGSAFFLCCCIGLGFFCCSRKATEHRGFIIRNNTPGQSLVNVNVEQSFPQCPPAYSLQALAPHIQQSQYSPIALQQQWSPGTLEFQNPLSDPPPSYREY